jgi:hypothetical protein
VEDNWIMYKILIQHKNIKLSDRSIDKGEKEALESILTSADYIPTAIETVVHFIVPLAS